MEWIDAKTAYGMFLDSDFWKSLSRKKRGMVGKCERCGSTDQLQSHHLFYRENWFDTQLEDLKCLCDSCHKKAHKLVPKNTPKKRKGNAHYTEILPDGTRREVWYQLKKQNPDVNRRKKKLKKKELRDINKGRHRWELIRSRGYA